MRLLLLTAFFPPANTMAAHRLYSFARYLPEFGIDVTVVTVQRPGTFRAKLERADVIRLYNDPSPVNRFVRRKTLVHRLYHRTGLRPLRNYYWGRFGRACIDYAKKTLDFSKFDAVLASYGPEDALRAGAWIHSRTGIPLIADFRDPWLGNLYYGWTPLESRIIQHLQRSLLEKSSLVITVSKTLAEALRKHLHTNRARVVVIYNGFYEQFHSHGSDERLTDERHRLKVCYCGSIYRGIQPLDIFLEGLKQVSAAHLYLALLDSTDVEFAQGLSARLGIENQVTVFLGLPYESSLKLQRECDVLLFLNRTDGAAKGVLAGKLFEYLSSGKFILGIGHPEDEAAQLLHEYRNARYVSTARAVAETLNNVAKYQASASDMSRFSRRNQARVLAECLRQVVS